MKKITSGKNITVMVGGKTHMVMCGPDNNQYLFDFLQQCDNEETMTLVCGNPLYQNYIKTYNEFPTAGCSVFSHGHKTSFIATDNKYTIVHENEEKEVVQLMVMSGVDVKDSAVPFSCPTEDEAIRDFYERAGYEPDKVLVLCDKCLSLHSIINIESGKVVNFSNEEIVNVQ